MQKTTTQNFTTTFLSKFILLICFLTLSFNANSQKLELVKDIFGGLDASAASEPLQLTKIQDKFFFSANDGTHGAELWISDGTQGGTYMLKDINNGINDSGPRFLSVYNNKLLFVANNGTSGFELWTSDGTETGTYMIKDIASGSGNSFPRLDFGKIFNDEFYFSATDGVNGSELWKTDGTEAGTQMVKNINPGSNSSIPDYLTLFNNKLYFRANNGTNGRELWMTDGTESGTHLVKDINPGNSGSSPFWLTVYNNKLFFSADDGTHGYELWSSDGTTAGTNLFLDLYTGTTSGVSSTLIVFNNKLFFSGRETTTGRELWTTDGTTANTQLLKDINPGDGWSSPDRFTISGDKLYFSAHHNSYGRELWVTDGTTEGTILTKDILAGGISTAVWTYWSYNNELYFFANNSTNGTELWKSNGTLETTVMVKDINPGSSSSYIHGERITFVTLNNKLFFGADNGINGLELFESDGTEAGTKLFKDLRKSVSTSDVGDCVSCNGAVYFNTTNGTQIGLWKSDGTNAGTVFLKSISEVKELSCSNNKLYFSGNDANGREVWTSDGTATGTVMVKDIYTGASSSFPRYFIEYNGKTYFTATSLDSQNRELWVTDGTSANTQMVIDLYPGNFNGVTSNLAVFNNKIYFGGSNGSSGYELWQSDGTSAGTTLPYEALPGSTSIFPDNLLAASNGKLYFTADTNGVYGRELWETDGTEANTNILTDLNSGNASSLSSSSADLVELNGNIYFTATDETDGYELWRSEPANGVSRKIADINNGGDSSVPTYKTVYNNKLYFWANNGVTGYELWKTDGTENHAELVLDITPGPQSSTRSKLAVLNNKLFLGAFSDEFGKELFYLDLSPEVTTLDATEITDTNARLGGNVTSNAGEELTKRGVVISIKSENNNPEIGGTGVTNIEFSSTAINSITSLLSGFTTNTTYVFKAYATNAFTTTYGEAKEFSTLSVPTTLWDGTTDSNWSEQTNWSGDVIPSNTQNIIIPDVTNTPIIGIGTSVQTNDLTIENSSSFHLTGNGATTVDGNFTNNGSFTMSSDETNSSSFIVKGTSNGTITYERGGLLANKWSIIAAPVSGQSIKEFVENTANNIRINTAATPNQYAVGYYDDSRPTGTKWVYYTVDDLTSNSITFEKGKGYAISRATDGHVSFTGTIDPANVTKSVVATQWNAVGNPYPAFLPINGNSGINFINDNSSKFDTSYLGVYIWDNAQNKYVVKSLVSSDASLAPAQGFFVRTTTGANTITFKETQRTSQPTSGGTFGKGISINKTPSIKLNVSNGTTTINTQIKYFSSATEGLDPGYDLGNYGDSTFDIFTRLVSDPKSIDFTIQSLPITSNKETTIIPIGIKAATGTTLEFSVVTKNLHKKFEIFIEDKLLNTFSSIKNSTYKVTTSEKQNNTGRFYLHLKTTSKEIPDTNENYIKVYTKNNFLIINGINQGEIDIELYNIVGERIFNTSTKANGRNSVELPNLKTGVYIVNTSSILGQKSNKIIIK